jgi:hypothetical protein
MSLGTAVKPIVADVAFSANGVTFGPDRSPWQVATVET